MPLPIPSQVSTSNLSYLLWTASLFWQSIGSGQAHKLIDILFTTEGIYIITLNREVPRVSPDTTNTELCFEETQL
jgi:hypothetical protein